MKKNKIPMTYQDYESKSFNEKLYNFELLKTLKKIVKETPNDLELGNKIRKFVNLNLKKYTEINNEF